jgi:hypothetical protein
LPANYGLAKGIKTSNLIIEGDRLVMQSAPFRSRSSEPLPSFLCATVSRLAHQQFLRHGIESSQLIMSFPQRFGNSFVDSLDHAVCRASERGDSYLVGLTPHFDPILGIGTVTRSSPFWEKFVVDEEQSSMLIAYDVTTESIFWDLSGKPIAVPLMAKRLGGNRLGLLSLYFTLSGGYFNVWTFYEVSRFSAESSAFIAQWSSKLALGLPLDHLELAVETIKQLGGLPDYKAALMQYRYIDYSTLDFPFRENKYADHAVRVHDEALPTMVEIVAKLPQEDILALAA